jgi:hypothetical protein
MTYVVLNAVCLQSRVSYRVKLGVAGAAGLHQDSQARCRAPFTYARSVYLVCFVHWSLQCPQQSQQAVLGLRTSTATSSGGRGFGRVVVQRSTCIVDEDQDSALLLAAILADLR